MLPHSLIIFIMKKLQEIDFCYETKARKVIVNFKFDALSRKAIRKFVLVGRESVTALTDSLPRLLLCMRDNYKTDVGLTHAGYICPH